MIPFAGPNWFIYPHSRYVESTGFNRGILGFGDTGAGYSSQNRSLSFSTYTETTHTAFGINKIQGMQCASPTHVYSMKGYSSAGAYTSNITKIQGFTNAESTVTIGFTTERRGGCVPMPHFQRARMYYAGGYSDSLAQYRTDITYVIQNTDTGVTVGAVLNTAKHMGGAFFNRTDAFFLDGYTTGGGGTSAMDKYTFSNDTIATSTADPSGAVQAPNTFSNDIVGYRIQGVGIGYTNNRKWTFSSSTWSTTVNTGVNSGQIFGSGQYVTPTEGAIWGGYNDFFAKRLVYRLAWATETWTDSSYTTGDANAGFIYWVTTY
jgi:hypothetical protein